MKENREKELIIALPKGRIFTEATECLVKAGVLSKPISDKSRKLILRDAKTGIRVLILRNHDVPIYVERGAADLGVIGRDVLLEQGRDVYEPLDMKVAPCRLMVAAPGASETFYSCTPCHSERIVVQQGLTREQWDEVLDLMVEEHEMEPITGDARTVILDYLGEHYGPDRPNFPR